MTLHQLLRGIKALSDLPGLVAELGGTTSWQVLPKSFWGSRGRAGLPVEVSALIGRSNELPWFAASGTAAGPLAQHLARILLKRGESAGILVHDATARSLACSVAFGECPVLALSMAAPDRVALDCLSRIAGLPPMARLAHAARIADALAGEGLGTRFFLAFEGQLDRLADEIRDIPRSENRRSLALLQLNRILFLYFIQSKGWLDGRPDFIRSHVDQCLGGRKQLHAHLLKPLFFGTLNREISQRTPATLAFGRVPFLNGGLFEPHALERRWRGTISNTVWRDVFDQLFERFHFTVREGTATAIAPDMLGRVFEGVMAPAERRGTGTFYTPPGLVRQIIDASFIALIVTRLGISSDEALVRLERKDRSIQPLLASLSLLDPAVGSGAFLLGALERLAELRGTPIGDPANVKRQILLENLFGVDINATAVRLTELRLWLAVIAEDSTEDMVDVTPLPNIDCLIRQGDSLTDPLALIARMPFRAAAAGGELAQLRRVFAVSTGREKPEAARALRAGEQSATASCLARADLEFERRVRELLFHAHAPDLFGTTLPQRNTLTRVRELRTRWAAVRQARRRFERDGEVPWFQFESHFADVFEKSGGFDVVVGNPPWVRAEQVPRAVREVLTQRYRWWRGGESGRRGYRHQPDLAVAFLERAHELAAPGGITGMLVPAKLATAEYGTLARRALARDLTIHMAADLSGGDRIFEATTYPMVIVSAKVRPPSGHCVRLGFGDGAPRVSQERFEGGSPWILKHAGAAGIARDLAVRHATLGEQFSIHLGVKTGANRVFLQPPIEVEPAIIRAAIRGRDLEPFRIDRTVSMLWPYAPDGTVMAHLPPIARAHFEKHASTLGARKDYKSGPPWILFRTGPATAPVRVIWADLASRLIAVALSGHQGRPLIPLNTCYVMPVRAVPMARAIAAWLNTTWMRAIAVLTADPASGGFYRFNAASVGRLPLPSAVPGDAGLADIAERAEHGQLDQGELDERAAVHLNLSTGEAGLLSAVAGAGTGHRR
ncbi:MAG: N-6 DNA methylase [Gemmatimonadota bacterium]